MICPKCGKEWSDKVYPIHIKRCTVGVLPIKLDNPMMFKEMSYNELRKVASEQGIELKNPKKNELIKLLEMKKNGSEQVNNND